MTPEETEHEGMTLQAHPVEALPAERCLQHEESVCSGPVEFRIPLSGTGIPFPRCEEHWSRRLEFEEQLRERYPDVQPLDFDPGFAGESWYEQE